LEDEAVACKTGIFATRHTNVALFIAVFAYINAEDVAVERAGLLLHASLKLMLLYRNLTSRYATYSLNDLAFNPED